MKKGIIVVGGLGVTPRRDRDVDRIMSGGENALRSLLIAVKIHQR